MLIIYLLSSDQFKLQKRGPYMLIIYLLEFELQQKMYHHRPSKADFFKSRGMGRLEHAQPLPPVAAPPSFPLL